MLIRVKTVEGRMARVSPTGAYIPDDRYVDVELTPYVARLLDHHKDIELEPALAKDTADAASQDRAPRIKEPKSEGII